MQLHVTNSTIHLSVIHLPPDVSSVLRAEDPAEDAITSDTSGTAHTPPAAGEYWARQGGYFICTLPALQGLPARHLIAAKDEAEDLRFGPEADVTRATSRIDGRANTQALVEHGGHTAAEYAANYSADGHSDFFLPAQLDLLMAYICAPQLFEKSGWYWSSSQYSRHCAICQYFQYGISDWSVKDSEFRARPFRAIPVNA